jgi:hypothetical protein
VNDIRHHLQHQPVLARPPHRSYLFAKLVRRNRLAFALGSVAFALLVAGFSISVLLFLREAEANQTQSRLRIEAEQARSAEKLMRIRAEEREKCAQAAVQMSYGKIAEADSLVADIRLGMVPSSLEAKDVFAKLGDWHRAAGRWDQAAERYTALVESHLSVDTADSPNVSLGTLFALGAVCRVGDWERYEHIRRIAIDRFAKSRDPHVAEQALKLILLRPINDSTLRDLAPLAEILRKSIPQARPENPAERNQQSWSCISLALWCYRSGDFAEAIAAVTHASVINEGWDPSRHAIADTILAMATWRAGRKEEARAMFSKVSASIPALRETVIDSPTSEFPAVWWDCAIAVALHGEGEKLFSSYVPD